MADQGNGTYIWDVEEQEWKNLGNVIGAQGPKGDTGNQGPQGPAGVDGATGATGPQGPQGERGPAGPSGANGADGEQGPMGPVGPQGPQGYTGQQGPQGPQGEPGSVGPQGIQGPAGRDGATGPQGPQGATGPQGPQGEQGIQGPAGATGADGERGSKILLYYDYDMDQPSWYNTGIIIEARILDTNGAPAQNIKPNDWVISGKFRYLIRLCERQQTTVGGVLTWVWTSTSDDRIPLPQGPTGSVESIAWKVSNWSLGKYPSTAGFNNVYVLGGLTGPNNQTPRAGQFFFTRTDNIFGFIGGVYDDSDPSYILYYAYIVDCMMITAVAGADGRSVCGTSADFTLDNDHRVFAYSTYLGGGNPHVGDVVYNFNSSYLGAIVSIDATNSTYTVGNISTALTQGPQGPQGPQGVTGPQGPRGYTGATGQVGPSGPQGVQGLPGRNGTNGRDGSKFVYTARDLTRSDDGTYLPYIYITGGRPNPGDILVSEGNVDKNIFRCGTFNDSDAVYIEYIGPFKGPKGDKGDKGDTGPRGPQGPALDSNLYYTKAEVNALIYNAKGGGWAVLGRVEKTFTAGAYVYGATEEEALNKRASDPPIILIPPSTGDPVYPYSIDQYIPYGIEVVSYTNVGVDLSAQPKVAITTAINGTRASQIRLYDSNTAGKRGIWLELNPHRTQHSSPTQPKYQWISCGIDHVEGYNEFLHAYYGHYSITYKVKYVHITRVIHNASERQNQNYTF